jgi:hypothetical protein
MADDEGGRNSTAIMAAVACATCDRHDEARRLVSDVPWREMRRDSLLLGSLCGGAQTAMLLDDAALATTIDELLSPYAGRNCMIALGTISTGPVDRYLSFTARTLGDLARAERHLVDAVALDERMEARRWLERDRADLASLLGSTVI